MKIRRILFFIIFVFVIVLSGCGGDATPQRLWNNYIKAMNEKDIEKVAEIYYAKDSNDYKAFIEKNDQDEYFDFGSLKTIAFSPTLVNNRYYSAEIVLNVDGDENTFDVYFIRDSNSPWRFISEVDLIAEEYENLGNKPNSAFYNNIIKNNGEFDYKYIYGGTPGVEGERDYVKIVYPNKKVKTITIPETIEGVPVTIIGDFAFYDYFRIFSVTFSNSKLQEIVLPNKLEVIEQYAFYQTKNLKYIELPSSLREVKNYAFASSGIQKLVINVNDEEAYANLAEKAGLDTMSIIGNRVVFMEDVAAYSLRGFNANQVTWTTNNEEVATIEANGRLTMHKPGVVEIKATSKDDSSIYSKAKVEIKAKSEKTMESTIPSIPAFSNFKFNVKKVFYTGEEFTASMSLPFNWSTSDPSVAKVEGAKVKMVGSGTVTLTATAQANPDVKASATITVLDVSEKNVKSEFSYESFTFTGARDMFVGDYIKLIAEGFTESQIEWSSSNEAVASVGRYSGLVTAKGTGTVDIRGIKVDNPNIAVVATITVSEPIKGPVFLENSLDRLHNLKELYINSINPYSVEFRGTLKLPSDVKIYVPEQNIETYKTVFSRYSKNIYPMP